MDPSTCVPDTCTDPGMGFSFEYTHRTDPGQPTGALVFSLSCGCGCGAHVATPPACRAAAPSGRAPGSKSLQGAYLRMLPRRLRINGDTLRRRYTRESATLLRVLGSRGDIPISPPKPLHARSLTDKVSMYKVNQR